MKPVMLNALSAQVQQKPFAHILSDQFFDPEFALELAEQFPDESYYQYHPASDGGFRKNLGRWDPWLYKFLETSPAWKKVYNYFVSYEFLSLFFNIFYPYMHLEGMNIDLSKFRLSLADKDLQRFQKFPGDRAYKKRIRKRIDMAVFGSGLNHVFEWIFGEQYCISFSLSYGLEGYQTPIHYDDRHKVGMFLYYVNDAQEIGGRGGELVLYDRLYEKSEYLKLKSPIDSKHLNVHVVLPPKHNRGILVLNSPYAYHSVTPMKETSKKRKFLYVGVERRWKRNTWAA